LNTVFHPYASVIILDERLHKIEAKAFTGDPALYIVYKVEYLELPVIRYTLTIIF
jgi:hypothetical protein